MVPQQHIVFAVTNDLTYDRRMQRICGALAKAGFNVTLIGRKLKKSTPFSISNVKAIRFPCWFTHGFLFYAEYNLRLFLWLLTGSYDVVCACDLDTALPVIMAAKLRRKKSVLDAHEFFTEVPEIAHRPLIKSFWGWVGRVTIPQFDLRYTVGEELARIMGVKYKRQFYVIRNIAPAIKMNAPAPELAERNKIILYQGALNVGRGLEKLVEAMKHLPEWQCWLAGEGDISNSLKTLTKQFQVESRVLFLGWVKPDELPALMAKAKLGVNLREEGSINDFYSLPNKFFDCIQAGLPSINMAFPEYVIVCEKYPCALLIDQVTIEKIVSAVQTLEQHPEKLLAMSTACHQAAQEFNWETEEKKLIQYYNQFT